MFPEITREDIFRLETRRLWLRWPTPADTEAALQFLGSATTPEAAAADPFPDDIAARLAAWRVGNTDGTMLSLVFTGRGHDRRVLGAISLVPVSGTIDQCGLRLRAWLDPAVAGQGLATEAVQAMVDTAFMLTDTPLVAASSRVLDPGFRRVVEKCGFTACGSGLDPAPDGRSLAASDRFRLDRKAWVSLKTWRVPGFVRGRTREPDAGKAVRVPG